MASFAVLRVYPGPLLPFLGSARGWRRFLAQRALDRKIVKSLELTDEGIGSKERPECPLPGTRTLVALPYTACSRSLESPVSSCSCFNGGPGLDKVLKRVTEGKE